MKIYISLNELLTNKLTYIKNTYFIYFKDNKVYFIYDIYVELYYSSKEYISEIYYILIKLGYDFYIQDLSLLDRFIGKDLLILINAENKYVNFFINNNFLEENESTLFINYNTFIDYNTLIK